MKRTVAIALGGLAVVFAAPAQAEQVDVNLASPGLVPIEVSDAGATVGGIAPSLVAGAVAHYDKQELMRAGALRASTTRLVASDGSDVEVSPNVTLEVKFTRRSAALDDVLDRYRARDVSSVVGSVDVSRLAAKARARTGRSAPAMEQWHHVELPGDVDAAAAARELLALGEVSFAYPAPDAAPPPQTTTTPSFSAMQNYLRPAPVGTDNDFSLQDPRTRGAGVRIADLEYYWTAEHEDLQLDPVAADLGGTAYPQYRNFNDEHGTAVFGEMVGKDNGFGVTGGVPNASMHGISPTRARATGNPQYIPSAALVYVAQFLSPGDVVLLEQQTVGPNGGTRYVPLEWNQANFDAIKMLSDLGIVVVETGGNGNEDLDSAPMMGRFDRAVRDSGAIVVGAGDSATRTALTFSSHGTRVDLQGYGNNITTTGGNGNLQGGNAPENVLRRYTRTFGGTSGAGPIVTNAVVAVQSYLKATGQGVYTAKQMTQLLRETGTPQTGTRLVGPLPNVAAALRAIEVDAPDTSASFSVPGVNGWYLNPTISLRADDGWGVGVDRHRVPARRRAVDAVHDAVRGARAERPHARAALDRQEGQRRERQRRRVQRLRPRDPGSAATRAARSRRRSR